MIGSISQKIEEYKALEAQKILEAQKAAQEKALLDKIEEYALTHTAPPAYAGTEMLFGWAVEDLLNVVPAIERVHALLAIKKKYGPLMTRRDSANELRLLGRSMSGSNTGLTQTAPPQRRIYALLDMLAMRMNWELGAFPFHVHTYKGKSVVYVFVVTNEDKAVVLEDDLGLFPSDQLVGTLRVMGG